MLEIKKGNPWIFWPSSICDSLPEIPADKFLNGKHSYVIDITLTLTDNLPTKRTLFSILPKYTGLDIDDGCLTFLLTTESETEIFSLPSVIVPNKKTNIILSYTYSERISLVVDGVILKEITLNEPLGFDENPHIIFGAGNFPKNGFNLNYTDINLHEFKFWVDDKLQSDHDFEKFIFDKSYDKTEKCNFIHKL